MYAEVNIDKLVEAIGMDREDVIVDLLGISLSHPDRDWRPECHEVEVNYEDYPRPLEGWCILLGECYALRWTRTDEAGIADVEIVERGAGETAETIAEAWAEDIAENLGV